MVGKIFLQKAMKLYDKLLTTVCNSLELCIFVLDTSWVVTFASWQARAMLYINVGDHLNSLLSASAVVLCQEIIKNLEPDEVILKKINCDINDNIVALDFRFFLLDGSVFIQVDIAEKKQLPSDNLVTLEEKLSAVNRLSDGIAHNLKSPLMALRGISDYMVFLSARWNMLTEQSCADCHYRAEQNKIQATLCQMRADIQNNVTVMTDIIGHLRAYNKIDRIHQFVLINLEDLLQKTINIMEYNTKLAAEIKFVPSKTGITQICCNPSDIQVVFTNILENAIEQILQQNIKQGKIEIRVKQALNSVVVKIKDNGGGIARHLLKTNALFEPFITTKKNEGTGLGLHSSFKIIKEHQGNIYARNHAGKIGKGAEFVVVLPVQNHGSGE